MNTVEQLAKVVTELDELRAEYKKLGDKIRRKAEQQEKLLLEINADNLKDPAWLLRNPTMPGAHEDTVKLIESLYGGKYNGPHPSGYIHDDEYKPIQKNFNFWLKDYSKEGNREMFRKNCEHFIQNFMPLLDAVHEISSLWNDKFPKVKVVPFQFHSEETGLDYLGYCPADTRWYYYTVVHGRMNTERVFNSWHAAFDFAYAIANQTHSHDDD
jgi:hypothetical protein